MSDTSTQNPTIVWEEFYNKLGYLYYGIAAAAGPVNGDSIELLRRAVSRLWQRKSQELTGFQGYTANKVEALFDWLNLNETEWEYCVNEFAYFAKAHHEDMPEHMRIFALESAAEIAGLMGGPDNPALKQLLSVLG